jgi:hypothetical protein
LLMGAAAGALAIWVVSLLLGMARNRGLNMGPLALTTADRAASRRHRGRGAA